MFKLPVIGSFIIKKTWLFPLFLRLLVLYNQEDEDAISLLMALDSI